jgi:hypothetical protein
MATLYTKVKLYIEANSATWDNTKVSLQNDGSGDYIKLWTYIDDGKLDKTGSWYTHIKAVKDANSKE